MEHNKHTMTPNNTEDLLRALRLKYEEIKKENLGARKAANDLSAEAARLFYPEKPQSLAWRVSLVKMDEVFKLVTEVWDGIRCVSCSTVVTGGSGLFHMNPNAGLVLFPDPAHENGSHVLLRPLFLRSGSVPLQNKSNYAKKAVDVFVPNKVKEICMMSPDAGYTPEQVGRSHSFAASVFFACLPLHRVSPAHPMS